jgi:hypothetical protein
MFRAAQLFSSKSLPLRRLDRRFASANVELLTAERRRSFGAELGIRSFATKTKAELWVTDRAEQVTKLQDEIDDLGELCGDARDLIDDAKSNLNQAHYSDDFEDALEAVEECVETYQSILDGLPSDERADVERRVGFNITDLQKSFAALPAKSAAKK